MYLRCMKKDLQSVRLAYRLRFTYAMLSSDSLAHTKCILPKSTFDEEYIRQHKSTLSGGCKTFGVKSIKKMYFSFQTELLSTAMNQRTSDFTNVEKRSKYSKGYYLFNRGFIPFNFCNFIKMRKMCIFQISEYVCMYLLLTKSQGRKRYNKKQLRKKESNCETRCVTNNNTKLK